MKLFSGACKNLSRSISSDPDKSIYCSAVSHFPDSAQTHHRVSPVLNSDREDEEVKDDDDSSSSTSSYVMVNIFL